MPLLIVLGLCNDLRKPIDILDFGGAFASLYFRNFDILNKINLNWNIVDQDKIVSSSKELFKNYNQLKFLTLDQLENSKCELEYDILYFGSSLQFIKNAEEVLRSLPTPSVQNIVIEQTPVVQSGVSKITIQEVREPIYQSSYPSWHFAEDDLIEWVGDSFSLHFKSHSHQLQCEGFDSSLKDYVFTKKTSIF